ncbi:hypothetical protein BDN71DRAFT_1512292 [Pleurotus eryngii]|uniref:Uncharacterized protein n=1 Tax=Pleurotus eryngii TaxID=5323 RepID=A0A9P6DA33_PLEER|nr:hypothetical protein BDN71DRAFT_1512292 [Pleurotus eryngii]
MPIDAIPLFCYNQLNVGPLGPQATAWERPIPSQLIVDYTDHRFLDILLAMRCSWDTVPIALLRREFEYVLGTIGASIALGHIVTPGPIVRALAQGLKEDSIMPSSFQDSHQLGKALNLARINRLKQANQPLAHRYAWWETSASHRATELDQTSPSSLILLAVTIVQCLEEWGEQILVTEAERNICLYEDGDERLDILTRMMSILEVGINDRMMAIAADRQEEAALFDIYEAVIYKEADNLDKVETLQIATKLDDEIQRIVDNNEPPPKHKNRKKTTKAMEDHRRKIHSLVDLINKVARQSLKAIPNQANAFWSEGPDLSLEEVITEFSPVPEIGSLEIHDRYFRTLPSGSERSGDTLNQGAKIHNAQFPLIYDLQPLTPIQPKDDGDIPHITSANRPHNCLASVFQTPKLSKSLQSSLRRSEPTMYVSPIAHHNEPEYVPSSLDTPIASLLPATDILQTDDESLEGTSTSIVGTKLASRQASAQPSAGSASGSDASLSSESVSQPDIDDTDDARSLGRSSDDTQSLGGGFTDLSTPQNIIRPYVPHHTSLATSDDEASLGGQSTEDLSSDNKIADDHPHIPHHASLATSDDRASLGGQLTEDPSSDDKMADDESTEEITLGVDLSRHTEHTPPAALEAEDDDNAMSLGSFTDDEADNSQPFSMLEMQANISNMPSSPECGHMGSPIEELDDAYSEYSDDSDRDEDIPDDVWAYRQTTHTPGFQSRYQHVHFEHIPNAEFADDVL